MKLSRRDVLKLSGLAAVGGAGLAIPLGHGVSGSSASLLPSKNMPIPYTNMFSRLPVLPKSMTAEHPTGTDAYPADGMGPIDYYDIAALPGSARLVPGFPATPLLGYEGMIPARRIDVDTGTRIVMRMHNKLHLTDIGLNSPLNLSTHLHGSASLPQYDGYAADLTMPGQVKTYHYPNVQTARTLWYHDHGAHWTGQNVYSGLASQYHLHDAMERALLPQGEFDVGLIISDMMFQANASLLFDDRTHAGLWGDVILVNGKPWPVMKVKKRIYRFRVLDASISRSYRFTTSPQAPLRVVATDAGLMPRSQEVTQWRHGTAERYEILIDFSGFRAGQRIELQNLSNPNNRDFNNTNKVMAFDVVDDQFDTNDPGARVMPEVLNYSNECMALQEIPGMKVRTIRVEHDDTTNTWSLNGMTWDEIVTSGYRKVIANPGLGDTEIWEIQNNSGGWFHPVHIHLIDFKVLSRNGKPPFPWELGPKDVIYAGEGERVRLIMKFGSRVPGDPFGVQVGKYMVHCHNLVHEDHDMMSQFSVGLPADPTGTMVQAGYVDRNDPVTADPAVTDPAL